METQKNNRNIKIDIMRGIAIISVVIGHAMNTEVYTSDIAENLRKFVYLYHLAVFFICAGYIYKEERNPRLIIKKIVRIVKKNYLKTTLVALGSFLILPFWVKIGAYDSLTVKEIMNRVIQTICFMPNGIFTGALWFVPFFVYTNILFIVINLLRGKKLKILIYILCASFGFFLSAYKINGGIVGSICSMVYLDKVLIAVPIMGLGFAYSEAEKNIKKFVNRICQPYTWIGFAILLLLLNFSTGLEIEFAQNKYYGFWAFYPVTILAVMFVLSLTNTIVKNRLLSVILQFIGENSFIIMAIHFIVFKVIDVLVTCVFFGAEFEKVGIDAFPISFPHARVVYIFGGIIVPIIIIIGKRFIKSALYDYTGSF